MSETKATLVSASMRDGFHGARDAFLLSKCDPEGSKGMHVQCTSETRDLLKRAGFLRVKTHDFRLVPVVLDRFDRLQLAATVEHQSPAALLGSIKSAAKSEASRANGKLGGRPRKA